MVMIRPKGKPLQIAEQVLKKKGIKVGRKDKPTKTTLNPPYLQH